MHFLIASLCISIAGSQPSTRLHGLFLGDRAYHRPEDRLHDVWGPLARRGIVLDWEEDLDAVTPELLDRYDCVVMYANHPESPEVPPAFLDALDDFIRRGGGFAALHCTSGCFMESPGWLNMIGARFESHGGEVFAQAVVNDEHPITTAWTPFETWDETYVQTHIPDDRTVLAARGDEPWCWVRDHGKGRVFYTASGHDGRTWTDPGWIEHLARAIVWASGDQAAAAHAAFEPVTFSHEPHAWVPNYEGHDPPMPFQLASTPEQAVAAMITPAGFHAELFASEPMVVNPIAMTWDERGRCWVIESPDYPNDVRVDGAGSDRISVLTDTNGDGVADTKTVFAEDLNLPTGLLKVTGGLIVAAPPHLLLYEDVDGDDQADLRETLFTGFGTWDTHAGPSNLAWGPDNRIWGAIGYAGFEDDAGRFGSGLWRWDQADPRPEFVAQFTNNTWGLGLRDDGEVFGSTANGAPSFFVGTPKPDLAASHLEHPGAAPVGDSTVVHPAQSRLQQGDFPGQYTGAAGHAFATGRQVPAHWPDRMAFICEPTAHLVGRQVTQPDGAGFRTRDCFNLVASTDEWFCPVQAEVGPDGAVWIADLSQFIILHNLPGDPERGLPSIEFGAGNAHVNPLRDRTHGRIYRLVADDAGEVLDLTAASPARLVETLSHENRFWRTTARRLLVEGLHVEAADDLHAVARAGDSEASAASIRTLHGLGLLGGDQGVETLRVALSSGHQAARHAALASLPRSERAVGVLLDSAALLHVNPATRRHAYLAAARLPSSTAMGVTLAGCALTESLDDPWLATALAAAASRHADAFVTAVAPLTSSQQNPKAHSILALAQKHASDVADSPGSQDIDLPGGDVQAGRAVFEQHTVVACFRCHSLTGRQIGLGPDLSTVGDRLTPSQILESIRAPSAALPGDWPHPRSTMPALAPFLSDAELRDLVAFLSSCTAAPEPAP